MKIRPHSSKIIVNFPDVELQEAWSPAQLIALFSHKPDYFDQVSYPMIFLTIKIDSHA